MIRLAYRRPGPNQEPLWFETTAMRQSNHYNDDILLIAMSRGIDAQKAEEIRLQEQLWLQAEELRVTTGRMRRTICFYDVAQQTLTLPQEYADSYGIPRVIENYPDAMLSQYHTLPPETVEKIRTFYDAIRAGQPEGGCELQLQTPDAIYHWKRWEFATVYDRKGAPRRAVIFVEDITEERIAQQEIRNRAERDGMTGLLNRATTQERIMQMIAAEKPGILLHIDLDDLKTINDLYGHNAGDIALQAIADNLRMHFRESDIIGRIGGDEFLVYLPGAAGDPDAIAATVNTLLQNLTTIAVGSHESHFVHCSIGGAICNETANTFQKLYKQADVALYHIKRNGKNSFAFYQPEMDEADYQFRSRHLTTQNP